MSDGRDLSAHPPKRFAQDHPKVYLGDGAYAEFDGFSLAISTWDGITTTNIVYIEPDGVKTLADFARQCGFKI